MKQRGDLLGAVHVAGRPVNGELTFIAAMVAAAVDAALAGDLLSEQWLERCSLRYLELLSPADVDAGDIQQLLLQRLQEDERHIPTTYQATLFERMVAWGD